VGLGELHNKAATGKTREQVRILPERTPLARARRGAATPASSPPSWPATASIVC